MFSLFFEGSKLPDNNEPILMLALNLQWSPASYTIFLSTDLANSS
jgi:hypothetical protein